MGRRGPVRGGWFALFFIALALGVALIGVVSTVESFRQDVAVAEVVALEHVDRGPYPRARVRLPVPDGRVVTPLVTRHHPRLQPGYRVEVRYDPDDPEAAAEYDPSNGWTGPFLLLGGVLLAVVGVFFLRKDLAAARRRDE